MDVPDGELYSSPRLIEETMPDNLGALANSPYQVRIPKNEKK